MAAVAAALPAFALPAQGAMLYWDLNGIAANTGTSATGNWNGATANWNDSSPGTGGTPTAITTTADDVVFSSGTNYTTGTVTVSSGMNAGSITFEEGTLTLSGGSINLGSTTSAFNGIIVNATSGAPSIGSAINLNVSQSWVNNSNSLFSASGALSLGGNALTISGTGNTTISGSISGVSGSIVKNGTGTLTLSSTSSVFSGGITINNGTVTTAATATPFGTGVITLSGGKLQFTASNATYSNAITVNGTSTIEGNSATNGTKTFSGDLTVSSGVSTLTISDLSGSADTMLFSGNINFDTSFTLAGTFNGGNSIIFGAAGKNITYTDDRTITFANTFTSGSQTWRGTLNGTAGKTLTLAGSGTVVFGDTTSVVSGSAGGGLIVNGLTISGGTQNAFTGGITLQSGALRYSVSTSGTTGPFGGGALTLSGGTLRATEGVNLGNNITVNGNVTWDLSKTANVTATLSGAQTWTNNGSLTITNSGNDSGSAFSVTGAITQNSDFSILQTSNVTATFSNRISGGTNNLYVKGRGTTSLTNSSGTASTLGGVIIGDAVASGSAGGTLTVNSQNALGTGSVTVEFGGTLNLSGVVPNNPFTVNNGGTYRINATLGAGSALFAGSGPAVFNSGSNFINNTGNGQNPVAGTGANQVSFPTAGVMFFNNGNSVTSSTKYPDLTGSLAIGGSQAAGNTTFSAATGISGTKTLAINVLGSAGGNSSIGFVLTGLTLSSGAELTLAGTGTTTGLKGLYANGGNSGVIVGNSVSNITGTGNVYFAMSPIAILGVGNASNFTGNLTLKSGTISVANPSTGKLFANVSSITLDGGTLRQAWNGGGSTTASDNFVVKSASALETFNANNNNDAKTFSGTFTDFGVGQTGAVTLRPGGTNGTSYPASIILSGNNSGFTGGFRVSTIHGGGRVQFNANGVSALNTLGSGGAGSIVVDAGAAFGFDAAMWAALNAGAVAKFSTSTDSILALDGMLSTNVDLTGTFNKDVRIGVVGGGTYTGTLTPYGSVYKFTPIGGTLTLGSANQLTGSRDLDVRAPAVAPGASDAVGGTLAITAAQNYTGATYVGGTVKNALMGGGVTGATLQIGTNGDLSGTSGITLTNGANLNIMGATTTGKITSALANGITVMGGATLTDGDTAAAGNNVGINNRITNTSVALTLGGTDGGGTFRMAYTNNGAQNISQTLGSLTLGQGANTVTTANTANGTVNIFFGATSNNYTRSTGGVVNFSTSATFNVNFTTAPSGTSTSIGAAGDRILIGAYLANADFVKAVAGTLVAPAYSTNNVLNTWTNDNIQVGGAVSGSVGNQTINSLRINSAQTIAIGAGNTLTIGSGMILGNNVNATISGGTGLTSSTNELIINQVTGNTLTISSAIVQNGSVNQTLTKTGAGTLTLSNTNNAISDIYANAGTIQVNTGAGSLGGSGTMNLLGGNVVVSLDALSGISFSKNIVVGAGGGAVGYIGTAGNNGTATATYTGTVSLNGMLNVNINGGTGGGAKTSTFANTISGAGALQVVGINNSSGRGGAILQGNNTSWSGGILLGTNTLVRLENTNAAGTGPITGSSTTVLALNAANISLANNIVGVANIVNWQTGNAATLSGTLVGTSGLTLQGFASGGNASETVLAGTVSYSGTPTNYNWSTTPTTSIQNFVNGQGGINAGATNYLGTSLLTANSSQTGYAAFELPGSTTANNGSLGFVRFSGVNSFIPGAVGPGYLAALHQANDATNYGNGTVNGLTGGASELFGFGLTGSSGTGSTYALPEGKSFVIGSLGTSVAAGSGQVGGKLYVASTGTTNNLAILTGSNKLAGFEAGDVNIHANGSSNTQTLALGANAANDTFQIGTTGQAVVFTPTYGDSGVTGAVTLMANRTGLTTINKVGSGVVEFKNAAFRNLAGTSIRNQFNINVNAGTLNYSQTDTGSDLYNSFNVNSGATLKGTGTIKGNVVITNGGRWAPGTSPGIQTAEAATWNSGGNYDWEVYNAGAAAAGSSTFDRIDLTGSLTLNATSGSKFNINILSMSSNSTYGNAIGFSNTNNYAWKILDAASAIGSSAADATGRLNLVATGFTNPVGAGTWSIERGDSINSNSYTNTGVITADSSELWIVFTGQTITSASYTLGMAPTTTMNLLKGGTLGGRTVTITNTGGVTADSINYTALGATSGNGSIATTSGTSNGGPLANGGGTANQVVSVNGVNYGSTSITASVGTTTNVTIGGSATLTPTAGSFTVNVGEASTGTGNTFGPALSALTAPSSAFVYASRTTAGGGNVGTEAIISGTNDADTETVSMEWRTRKTSEIPFGGTAPLFSDVVKISNVDVAYVVKMYYLDADNDGFVDGYPTVAESDLFLGRELSEPLALWDNAGTLGNKIFGGSTTTLGEWGIDTTNNYVWAVVMGSGTFAVIPEPTSLALLGLGAVGLLARRRRK